jgi:regulatory protein YycI of two-component signal transduction system YycFG
MITTKTIFLILFIILAVLLVITIVKEAILKIYNDADKIENEEENLN